jgi:hypothetical protein
VQAVADGHAYYDQIRRTLSANCSADIIAAVQYMDDALDSSTSSLPSQIQKDVNTGFNSTGNSGYNATSLAEELQGAFIWFTVCVTWNALCPY